MRGKVPNQNNLHNVVDNITNKAMDNSFTFSTNAVKDKKTRFRYKPIEMLTLLSHLNKNISSPQENKKFKSDSLSFEFIDGKTINKKTKIVTPWKYYGLLWGRLELENPIGLYNYVHIMPYCIVLGEESMSIEELKKNSGKDKKQIKENNFPDIDLSTGNIHLWQANNIQFVLSTNLVCALPTDCLNCTNCNNKNICGGFHKPDKGFGPGIKKVGSEEHIIEFCYSNSKTIKLENIKKTDNGKPNSCYEMTNVKSFATLC